MGNIYDHELMLLGTSGRARKAIEADRDKLKGIPQALAALLVSRRAQRATIKADARYSDAFREGLLADVESATKDKVQAMRERVAAAQERLADSFKRAGTNTDADTNAVLLKEIQEGKAWARARSMLDGGQTWHAVIHHASEAGDLTTLRALRAELPTYLRAGAKSEQVANFQVSGALEVLAKAEYPLLPSNERWLRDAQEELDLGLKNLHSAFGFADTELAGAWAAGTVPALPAWERGQAINVADTQAKA